MTLFLFVEGIMASTSRRIQSPARQLLISEDKATREALRGGLREHGEAVKDYLDDVVSDWRHKPDFRVTIRTQPNRLTLSVTPSGTEKAKKIFQYVDEGTQPHTIKPRNAKVLLFQPNYQPKTKPVALAHVGSGRATGDFVAAKEVHHPGSPARKFGETAMKEIKPSLDKRIDRTIRRALAQIG